ncbi:mucosal addressin cell adhesion molecule 1 isoform X1 [Trachypithecus francoisi]|uniref:mucosal addressin cell adhesion molecule 1 isoform X1 n=1 Tax=Trachypithecus francoisi TaxID=54180 RepID=UPI00141ADE1B|nr:mucosal addressin cell adhesion molecule 1 isoform X1 [Trachypithecus francoisi]
MDWGLALLLAGLLGLLQPGCGQSLQVEPPEPVVAVALGASRQLTCLLACADRGATVQWRGLDTSLGAVQSDAGRSVLTVRNASLSAAGTRVCVGSCGGRTFQHTVRLLVYAFPDQLTVSPAALVPGDPEVACTAHKVTPVDPNALSFSLLLGDQELEGAQALGPEVEEEEEPQEEEDVLFRVTERWRLPTLAAPVLPALYCQATMRLPGLELSHRQAIPATQASFLFLQHAGHDPVLGPLHGCALCLEYASSGSFQGSLLLPLRPLLLHSPTSREPPDTTSPEPQATTSPETTPQQGSTHSPRSPGSTRTCRPEISQAGPTQGEVIPTGSSKPAGDRLPAALWASSAVLGLLLLALSTYHLWKRCQHLAEDDAHPPASLRLLPQVSTWAGLRGTDQVGGSPS